MNVLLFVALAFPLGCLALVCCLALLGILMLAGALRGVGAIKGERGQSWPRFGRGQVRTVKPLDWIEGAPPLLTYGPSCAKSGRRGTA
jgi:hypothetical protein